MSKVTMIGTMTVQEGKADEAEKVLVKMVEAAREEPGCEVYSYHRGPDDVFHFFGIMSSAEAMQAHGQTGAMGEAMQEFMPLAAGRPQMTVCTPVAGLGLDL